MQEGRKKTQTGEETAVGVGVGAAVGVGVGFETAVSTPGR